MKHVYLGLGSNIPPQLQHLEDTLVVLRGVFPEGFQASKVYASSPYQQMKQEVYYNMACLIHTSLAPQLLLEKLLLIEKNLGRTRTDQKWGPRTIDIDILAYEGEMVHEEGLQIPHYDLANRDFFLVPLQEIAPAFVHPETNLSIPEMISQIQPENKTDLKVVR